MAIVSKNKSLKDNSWKNNGLFDKSLKKLCWVLVTTPGGSGNGDASLLKT